MADMGSSRSRATAAWGQQRKQVWPSANSNKLCAAGFHQAVDRTVIVSSQIDVGEAVGVPRDGIMPDAARNHSPDDDDAICANLEILHCVHE
jgi:hypothetical protein